MTASPTSVWVELPSCTVGRLCAPSIWDEGDVLARVGADEWAVRALVWPNSVTVTVVAPATTWLLVNTSPVEVRIIPLPAPSTNWPLSPVPPV